jgi:hypothetical protein
LKDKSDILIMKYFRIYLPVICLLTTFSCKKIVEDQKRQAVMSFITNGQWKVESYLVDTTSITAEFEGYKFKFNENGTVVGDNGIATASGTWVGEVSDYSITSQFPDAGDPLQKLDGRWAIKDSGLTFVKADMTTSGATMHLHLVKVP